MTTDAPFYTSSAPPHKHLRYIRVNHIYVIMYRAATVCWIYNVELNVKGRMFFSVPLHLQSFRVVVCPVKAEMGFRGNSFLYVMVLQAAASKLVTPLLTPNV